MAVTNGRWRMADGGWRMEKKTIKINKKYKYKVVKRYGLGSNKETDRQTDRQMDS